MTDQVDDLVTNIDPALVVVTTASQGERAGCLVGFHSQSSIQPFRYAVWLSKANHTYRVALTATHFAVHFLSDRDHELAELFGTETGDVVDKFAACAWSEGEGEVPLLDGCSSILFVKESVWDSAGDHMCFIGTPTADTAPQRFAPLRLAGADDLEPGHSAEEASAPLDRDAPGEALESLQEIALGFGHELTAEQVAAFNAEHDAADDHDR